jgi:cytosine/uracil/thiamine/allantoin permease
MGIMTNRAIITAAAALIALSTLGLQPASAGWRHNDEAIALGIFGAVLGTIAGVIVAEHGHEQPVYVPAYPYDRDDDVYGHGWRHRQHFHDHDHWQHEDEGR